MQLDRLPRWRDPLLDIYFDQEFRDRVETPTLAVWGGEQWIEHPSIHVVADRVYRVQAKITNIAYVDGTPRIRVVLATQNTTAWRTGDVTAIGVT